MEMIYDLRYRGIFALPWERSVRGCVLLMFFGILYLGIKACPTTDEVLQERIVVHRRVNAVPGIESKNICDGNRECVLIGFHDQSMSLAITNFKEIKKSAIKAAKEKRTKIREDTNVDRTIEMIMVRNNVPETAVASEFSDNNVETRKSDVENSSVPKTVIIESRVPEIEKTMPKFPDSNIQTKVPEINIKESEIDVKEPEIDIKESEIDVKEPEIDIKESEVDVKEPEVDIKESEVEVKEPEVDIKESEVDVKEPEATEGKEGNESIINDKESTVDKEDGKIIEGFLVDAQGYITGVTNDLVLLDEILVITADQGCVGIRDDAFSDIKGVVTEIYIPANIHNIEPEVFRYFQDLIYIEVSKENPYYNSVDGILYSSSREEIVCPAGR